MPRLVLPIVLVLLALLPAAQAVAAPAIGPRVSPVSASGVTEIEVANPGGRALSARVAIAVAGDVVASRRVRLPRRSVTAVRLRLAAGALEPLRAAGRLRATISLRAGREGRGAPTARRVVTLRAAKAPAPAPAPGAPAAGPAGPAPAPAASAPAPTAPAAAPAAQPGPTPAPAPASRWVGRMGPEGPYDDLELVLVDGGFELTKAPALPVFCFETGGHPNDSWTSGELFDAPGPWPIGTDGQIVKEGVAVNPLVGRSPRTITYKASGTTREAGRIAGTLGMSFFGARPHVFYGNLVIVNCAGSQSFEAVPAGG